MERTSLLSALSPQLKALVEASLGEVLPSPSDNTTARPLAAVRAGGGPGISAAVASESRENEVKASASTASASGGNARIHTSAAAPHSRVTKLNPSELFALRHPDSPGFVVKQSFLGRNNALAVRDALVAYAKRVAFHDAKIGSGESIREERALRGDRIHWIPRPRDLNDESSPLAPAIRLLMKRVEVLVLGIKRASPQLNLRNITSTQLAIFPGNGSRFVKHTDTYATTHPDAVTLGGGKNLSRLITCVYYLNDGWQPSHGGELRVFTPGNDFAPASEWDIPPQLDTLLVFRSHDVEHEVLPTSHERMAVTIWYYGQRSGKQEETTSTVMTVSSNADTTSPISTAAEPRPLPTLSNTFARSTSADSIFVAIPSYRDSECRHTVDDLLRRATFPDRISIGICLQSTEDDDTLAYLQSKYASDKVRIEFVKHRDAAGPCVSRARAQALWRGEAYYLQIDSHMRFRPGWDEFLIRELERCEGSTKPILTTYPLGYTLPNQISSDCRPTVLCARSFNDDGILRQSSRVLQQKAPRPLPSLFWAAGFAFSPSKVVEEVPYDASLRFLFFGEESSMSARLWTSGWDFFAPSEAVAYHLWTRSYRSTFHEVEDARAFELRQQSLAGVKRQLNGDDNVALSRGGGEATTVLLPLGSVRSLDEYQHHIGVDFKVRSIEWRAEWGNLDPQRFDLSTKSTMT